MALFETGGNMNVTELSPTDKYLSYKEELEREQKAGDPKRVRRAEYELELMKNSRFIEINGVVHHYQVSGPEDAEETVLLVHGWDCWWLWWHHVIRELNRQGIRTIAYDLKGHGWSNSDPRKDYSIASFSNDLAEIVEKLGIHDFHIAAFSFGPFVTLDYASKTHDNIKSIIFYNFGSTPNNAILERFAPAILTFTFNKVLRKIPWWQPLYAYARVVLARNPVSFHDIMVGVKSLELCCPEAILMTTRQITMREVTESIPDMVASVDVPLLFVAGDGDVIMSSRNIRKLRDCAKKGSYVCVPKCGHLITLELPEKATGLIVEQIQAVNGNRSTPGSS